MRDEVRRLCELGPLPGEKAPLEAFLRIEPLLLSLTKPATDEEARALVAVFGLDDSFGGAWTLVHLIETAPGWPLWDCLRETSNPWIIELRERAERGGFQPPDGSESE